MKREISVNIIKVKSEKRQKNCRRNKKEDIRGTINIDYIK
jgi:hypothetical protein